jgi:hypothetical protein
VGLFYRSLAGAIVLVRVSARRGTVSLEPLDTGARPLVAGECLAMAMCNLYT